MNNKFKIGDIVYIIEDSNHIIQSIITQITITVDNIKYRLCDVNKKSIYIRMEDEIFTSVSNADEYIFKHNLDKEIAKLENKTNDYRGWVANLDFAINNYERCETNIEIILKPTSTNEGDRRIFAVTNTGSKILLEYIKKYFKEILDKKEKELEKLKKKEYNTNV